jgi:hypothetical protein
MMAGPSPSMDYTTRTAYQAGAGSQHANTGDLVTNGLEGMGDSGLAMMASTSPSVSDGAEDFVFQGSNGNLWDMDESDTSAPTCSRG